ncbi:MAG TPA: hypothetical protein VIS96_16165 [Terrimicrobiaceae bacterium]
MREYSIERFEKIYPNIDLYIRILAKGSSNLLVIRSNYDGAASLPTQDSRALSDYSIHILDIKTELAPLGVSA